MRCCTRSIWLWMPGSGRKSIFGHLVVWSSPPTSRCALSGQKHIAAPAQKGRQPMDLGLNGKIAVVTGASKGIGLAVCRALALEGAHVIAGSRRGSAELDELAADGAVSSVLVDLSDSDGPSRLIEAADAHGGLDVLVNNVGAATI